MNGIDPKGLDKHVREYWSYMIKTKLLLTQKSKNPAIRKSIAEMTIKYEQRVYDRATSKDEYVQIVNQKLAELGNNSLESTKGLSSLSNARATNFAKCKDAKSDLPELLKWCKNLQAQADDVRKICQTLTKINNKTKFLHMEETQLMQMREKYVRILLMMREKYVKDNAASLGLSLMRREPTTLSLFPERGGSTNPDKSTNLDLDLKL